jgi:hypothetical protein
VVPPASDWSKVRYQLPFHCWHRNTSWRKWFPCWRLVQGTVSTSVPTWAQEYILAEVVPPADDWSKVRYQLPFQHGRMNTSWRKWFPLLATGQRYGINSVPTWAQEYILAEVVPPADDWSKVWYQLPFQHGCRNTSWRKWFPLLATGQRYGIIFRSNIAARIHPGGSGSSCWRLV